MYLNPFYNIEPRAYNRNIHQSSYLYTITDQMVACRLRLRSTLFSGDKSLEIVRDLPLTSLGERFVAWWSGL